MWNCGYSVWKKGRSIPIWDTGTNEVSGTSEFLPLEPPVPDTGAGKSSLERNHKKLRRLHIFEVRDLVDGLK